MTLTEYAVFFGVTFIAAAINSVAGGGTFLTFPIFIMFGLTGLQANIMSTIALWPGTIASAYGYKDELDAHKTTLLPLLFISLAGGVCGAALLLSTPETVFSALVPWLLLLATSVFTFGHRLIAILRKGKTNAPGKGIVYAGMLFIAFYGGYFGAGIGILTLAMLQLMGMTHIHRMNALKTLITSAINAITAIMFMCSGKVIWSLALVMVAGGVTGGYVGARLSLKVSPRKIRALIICIGFGMTAYFFLHGA